jgi:L-seryl-tRNA(Ser) seleniumtransferase
VNSPSSSAPIASLLGEAPYQALGVRTHINAAGLRTINGGSRMRQEVLTAMERAALAFVDMDELMDAASRRLALMTGAEAGIVTAGAAAAMTLAAAACRVGNDPVGVLSLPFAEGRPKHAIIPEGHRLAYEVALRAAGADLVDVTDADALAAALRDNPAMIFMLADRADEGPLPFDDILAVARSSGTPILIDAAPGWPQRPDPWLARGADLVIYSGGKHLMGPQASGFLLGRAELVEAAWRNASPHHGIGRNLKVSKETVIGALAALEAWLAEDRSEATRRWDDDLLVIAERLQPLDLTLERVQSPSALSPRLRISWSKAASALDGPDLWRALRDGEPRIALRELGARDNHIEIDPVCLQPGEAKQVAEAVLSAFSGARQRPIASTPPPMVDLSGSWAAVVRYSGASRTIDLELSQSVAVVAGAHRSDGFTGRVTGQVEGAEVRLVLSGLVAGAMVTMRVDGAATSDALTGRVRLGVSNPSDDGPDFSADQFGSADFVATRREPV